MGYCPAGLEGWTTEVVVMTLAVTMVELAGQLVTVAAQEVMVTSTVLVKVMVLGVSSGASGVVELVPGTLLAVEELG